MKYVRFAVNEEVMYGVLEEDKITQLEGNFLQGTPGNLDTTFNLNEVKLLPLVVPRQMVAIGLNYALHAEESGLPIPDEPMMFMVSPTAMKTK